MPLGDLGLSSPLGQANHRTISRTVIIAAATVVILGSLLDQAKILVEGATRRLGK